MRAKTLQEHVAQGTFRPDRHRGLLNESERPKDISPNEWRYLRIALLGSVADRGDVMVHCCDHCLVHGCECEELFPTETAAKFGCNPLDFAEPVIA
jgi:hypothetical protein